MPTPVWHVYCKKSYNNKLNQSRIDLSKAGRWPYFHFNSRRPVLSEGKTPGRQLFNLNKNKLYIERRLL